MVSIKLVSVLLLASAVCGTYVTAPIRSQVANQQPGWFSSLLSNTIVRCRMCKYCCGSNAVNRQQCCNCQYIECSGSVNEQNGQNPGNQDNQYPIPPQRIQTDSTSTTDAASNTPGSNVPGTPANDEYPLPPLVSNPPVIQTSTPAQDMTPLITTTLTSPPSSSPPTTRSNIIIDSYPRPPSNPSNSYVVPQNLYPVAPIVPPAPCTPPPTAAPSTPAPCIPTMPTTPAPKRCCYVNIHDIKATITCGIVGQACCHQPKTCQNAKDVTLSINRAAFAIPSGLIPCEEAIKMGYIKESDLQGVCTQYVPSVADNYPTGNVYQNGHGHVQPGREMNSSTMTTVLSSIISIISAFLFCFY